MSGQALSSEAIMRQAGAVRRRWRTRVVALILGIVAISAAMVGDAFATVGQTTSSASAFQVDLTQTGGFAGVNEHFVVERQATTTELFAIVDSVEFRALDKSYLPESECCDLFRYDVTVHYTDNTIKSVVTMTGADMPEILWTVIELVQKLGNCVRS